MKNVNKFYIKDIAESWTKLYHCRVEVLSASTVRKQDDCFHLRKLFYILLSTVIGYLSGLRVWLLVICIELATY